MHRNVADRHWGVCSLYDKTFWSELYSEMWCHTFWQKFYDVLKEGSFSIFRFKEWTKQTTSRGFCSAECLVLAWLIPRPWRWKQDVTPKCLKTYQSTWCYPRIDEITTLTIFSLVKFFKCTGEPHLIKRSVLKLLVLVCALLVNTNCS
jgi:hypothetical protein